MIERFKRVVRRHWPPLRLRTILLSTFLFVAALPGFGALFLRVYENSLVRQTEAELVAQGAALASVAAVEWSGDYVATPPIAEPPSIDLRLGSILPERPAARRSDGTVDPVVAAWSRRLDPVVRMTSQSTRASILLLDRRGRILGNGHADGSYADLPEVRSALRGRSATTLRRNDGYRRTVALEWFSRASDLRLHYARPIVGDGAVIGVLLLSRTPRALFAGMYEDRGKIALGVAAIFALLVVLSGLLSRGIVRPVEALGRATRVVAGGGGPVPPAPTTAAIEIQALYRDFGVMAEAIERRSRYLRDFAHAVSHEFKTPLAGIVGAVELLQDHPAMGAVDRERFLRNIGADATRLSLLVSRLLDLARADMAKMTESVVADVTVAVRRVADAFSAADFTVRSTSSALRATVGVPPAVIETVLTALTENSRQSGASRVTITVEARAGAVELTVGDDGPGIPPGDRDRIFEPFFTSRRASGGTGLGLPIIRSLLHAHGGTIRLVEADGRGAIFAIVLPAAVTAPQWDV